MADRKKFTALFFILTYNNVMIKELIKRLRVFSINSKKFLERFKFLSFHANIWRKRPVLTDAS